MRNKYWAYLILLFASIFTIYIYVINSKAISSENDEWSSLNVRLADKLLQYVEAIEYPIDSNLHFTNSKEKSFRVSEISSYPRVCLYIDGRHCTSCWKDEMRNLKYWNDSARFAIRPIIIANNFSGRELKIIQKQTDFEIYSMGSQINFLPALTKFNVPFYFVMEGGYVCCPYFPSKNDMGDFPVRYFKHISNLTKRMDAKKTGAANALSLLNADVELGTVDFRKKISITYTMKNLGNTICKVFDCQPSCTCIVVDSFSSVIPPGETGYVAITTVQNSKGAFQHSVRIHTDYSREPYEVHFTGVCK